MDIEAWWAAVHGVAESQTQLNMCTHTQSYWAHDIHPVNICRIVPASRSFNFHKNSRIKERSDESVPDYSLVFFININFTGVKSIGSGSTSLVTLKVKVKVAQSV